MSMPDDSEAWDKIPLPSNPESEWIATMNQVYAYRSDMSLRAEWWNERLDNGHGRPMSASEFGMEVCKLRGVFGGITYEATTTGQQNVIALLQPKRESIDGEFVEIESAQVVTVALDQVMGSVALRKS